MEFIEKWTNNKPMDRVEILAFDVYKSPLLLCEGRTIDRTRLITFLNRRNSENS